MALVVKDRVRVTTTTTGTSDFTLGSAVSGYQAFSVIGNGNTTYYVAADAATGDWEVGVGTYSSTGPTLTRDTVLESSNSGSKVVFAAGPKDVFCAYPAERAVYLNAAGLSVDVLDIGTLGVGTANITTANITAGVITTTPTSATDIANKSYVDTIASSGITYHTPVKYEVPNTTGNLNAAYNNGTGGVGATLTNAGTKAAFAPDGPTAQVGDRILIYNQTNAYENGVYEVSVVGTPDPGGTNWVLTRTADADSYGLKDPNALGNGDAFFITSGNTGAGETYVCNTTGTITFGTTNITFVQVSSAQIYSAGTGLSLSGTQFSIANTGVTATTYGSASAVPVLAVNAQGQITSVTNTNISIGAGAVTGLAASATTDTTNASNITTGTLQSARLTGSYTGITGVGTLTAGTWNASTIGVPYGGTGLTSYAVGDLLYADTTSSLAKLADVATGNALISGGVGTAPSWGKIGLTTHVSGTLAVSNGGTGATTLTGYVYGNGTGAFTASTTIPNSATTATSSNTASAIVARDASGNFSATTITANLSGNASTATSATSATTATNLAGGVAGAVPYQSAAGTTGFSAAGTSGQYLQSNGTAAPTWVTPATVNNGTLTLSVSGTGLSGSQTFTANQATNATFTVTSNATASNTANTIVSRDASGNFSATTITAALSGNASTATTATQVGNSVTFNNTGSGATSGSTFNGSAALTVSYNTVGAPSTSGTNATGSWGISITGSAASATTASTANALNTANDYQVNSLAIGGTRIGNSALSVNGTTSNDDSQIVLKKPSQSVWSNLTWDGIVYQGFNIYYDNGGWVHSAPAGNGNNSLFSFSSDGAKWWASNNSTSSWNVANGVSLWSQAGVWTGSLNAATGAQVNSNTILHAGNYNTYAPTLTGTGATGTWGIAISGNAASSSRVTGYSLNETGGSASWLYLGEWSSATQAGAKISIKIVCGQGYNATNAQNQVTEIFFKTSNGSSSQAGSTGVFYADGMCWKLGPNTASPSTVRVVQVNSGTYQFYGNFSTFTGQNSFYTVSNVTGAWSHSGAAVTPSGNYVDLPIYPILDSSNYNSYAPTLTGTGASGTWSIAITGNAATASNASQLNGISAVNLYNNMGQAHSTRTSFDATTPSYDFGYRFVQGSTNGPGTGGGQYYSWYIGLGSDYAATGANSYGAMFAVDRNTTTPYLSVRYNEGNSFSTWRKIRSGYADSAGASTNLSGGVAGAIPYQSAASTTLFSAAGSAGQALTSGGTGAPTWTTVSNANSASTIVSRDASGGTALGYLNNNTWYNYNDNDRNANSATYYPNASTRAVRYFFANASSVGTGGNYAGVMQFNPWEGTTVSTGDASYQLAFGSTAANSGGVPQLRLRKGIDTTWNAWIDLLTSSNYNSYSPTLTGTGASGTWGIAITGNAATATNASYAYNYTQSFASNWNTDFANAPAGSMILRGDTSTGSSANGPGGTWWFQQNFRHTNNTNVWGVQIAWGWEDNANLLRTRNVTSGTYGAWITYLNSNNYNSYSPTLTGGGASGTWGINISGNASTATTASNVNNGTLTLNVSGTGLSGSQTFTANQSTNATFTVTSNATAVNTGSTIVARDASGNFAAGAITGGSDGAFNSVRIGRGNGNVATNTTLGFEANNSITTSARNTAIGYQANAALVDKVNVGLDYDGNTAVGYRALRLNTASALGIYSSTAVGAAALAAATTGYYNTAVGAGALNALTTNTLSTAVGALAGRSATGANCAFFGYAAGDTSTGNGNSFIGYNAGSAMTTGASNVILGSFTGTSGALNITTDTGNIVLSSGTGAVRARIDSSSNWSTAGSGSTTLYPAYMARAWVNFNGTGTVAIRASGNVTSITDNGVGSYTINITTALQDANYAVVATVGVLAGTAVLVRNTARATNTTTINTINTAVGDVDVADIMVALVR